MIKFFRRIRQQLLTENKFSKYMLYAIGEIVLVVIGILIALQLNNWNSNRIQKQKESLLLNALNEEFKSNKMQLDSVLTKHKYSMKSVEYLMSRLPIKNTKTSLHLQRLWPSTYRMEMPLDGCREEWNLDRALWVGEVFLATPGIRKCKRN